MWPALLLLLGCDAVAPRPGPAVTPEPCHVRGVDAETRCATVPVPLDPADPASPTVALRVVVVPAVRPDPRPDPVYFLAGGPGQAATEVIGGVLPGLSRVQRHRDLVFVDIRGTGASAPMDCPPPAEGAGLAALFADTPAAADVDACLAALPHPPRHFTTERVVADLERVADALGHPRVNLVGASYGTRLGLSWMRRHPERIRAAVLDGVAPPTVPLFLTFARDAQAALDHWLADCAGDPACAAAAPDPRADLAAAFARAEAPVTLRHPRTGAEETLTLGRDGLAGALRTVLYLPVLAAHLPVTLHAAAEGDPAALVAMTVALGDGAAESTSTGLLLSVVCAEDLPRVDRAAAAAQAEGTFLGPGLVEAMADLCARWPAGAPAPDHAEPVRADTPVLLLSGERDPVTPPRLAEEAARTLPRAVSVTVPGAGHGTLSLGCVPRLVEAFVAAADPAVVDPACVAGMRAPPASLSPLGSAP